MFKKILFTAAFAALTISGCQSNQLTPEAQKVILAPNPPPSGCKYLGALTTDKQASFMSVGFSTNSKMEQIAMNDLQNQAAKLGANYVQMFTTRTGSDNPDQINVSYSGKAYKCPRAS
jgi:outer membrane murein-binding lipoprotein Lpp